MKRDFLDEFLNDAEKSAVQQFYDNELMREAVRKVLLFGVYNNGVLKKGKPANPLLNFALGFVSNRPEFDNETIGAKLRASWEGINFLEIAFSNMAKYKKEEEKVVDNKNPAR